MRKNKNVRRSQQGFGLVEGLIVIVLLLALTGAGFFVWHRSKSKSPNTTDTTTQTVKTTTQSQQSAPQGDTLAIDDWKVQMTIPSAFKTSDSARVVFAFGKDKNTILLGSDLQSSLPSSCSFSSTNDGLDGPWGISREAAGTLKDADGMTMKDSDADTNSAYIHVGGYYYHRIYPQQGCENAMSQVTALDQAYTALFKSLKAL